MKLRDYYLLNLKKKLNENKLVLLLHLLVAGCNIDVRFSVHPSVCPSVNIYVDVRHLCQS